MHVENALEKKKEKALGELGLCMWCAGIPLILDILDQSC